MERNGAGDGCELLKDQVPTYRGEGGSCCAKRCPPPGRKLATVRRTPQPDGRRTRDEDEDVDDGKDDKDKDSNGNGASR